MYLDGIQTLPETVVDFLSLISGNYVKKSIWAVIADEKIGGSNLDIVLQSNYGEGG